jgi:diguanylate cyclase (GGDEF)-like protein
VAVLLDMISYKVMKSFEKEMESLASTDNLTNTANRRELEKQFKLLKYRSSRYDSALSLILIDLDNFKYINDTYGHLMGDTVLQKVAFTLQNSIRPIDLLARWGGDEFVILMEAPVEEALVKAEKMLQFCTDLSLKDSKGMPVDITISAGVSGYEKGDSLKKLTEKADKALLRSKAEGKNRVTLSGSFED